MTLLKSSTSGKGKSPMELEEVVTISEKAPMTPIGILMEKASEGIPRDKSVEVVAVDKPQDTSASIGSEETEGVFQPTM